MILLQTGSDACKPSLGPNPPSSSLQMQVLSLSKIDFDMRIFSEQSYAHTFVFLPSICTSLLSSQLLIFFSHIHTYTWHVPSSSPVSYAGGQASRDASPVSCSRRATLGSTDSDTPVRVLDICAYLTCLLWSRFRGSGSKERCGSRRSDCVTCARLGVHPLIMPLRVRPAACQWPARFPWTLNSQSCFSHMRCKQASSTHRITWQFLSEAASLIKWLTDLLTALGTISYSIQASPLRSAARMCFVWRPHLHR